MPSQVLVCLDRTLCFDVEDGTTGGDVKRMLEDRVGVPSGLLQLFSGTKLLSDAATAPAAPYVLRACLAGGLLGGKGGFGAMLRAMGKGANFKRTENFGACRDLSGRRLRHVNQDMRLRNWASKAEQARRKKEGTEYKESAGEHGITGWFLGVPSWAEGFKKGKKDPRFRKVRRKTKMCSNWLEARKLRKAPEGAPPWWGCPRGRDCQWAHGASELRGDGKLDYEKQKKEKHHTDMRDAIDGIASVQAEVGDRMTDAVLMGIRARKRGKRRKVDRSAAEGADFLPVDVTGSRRGLRWDTSAWVVGLGGDHEVTVDYSEDRAVAEVEGQADFATAKVAGLSLGAGHWYYEVTLLSGGLVQIGWADGLFAGSSADGDGVGDHVHSWSYDGTRQKKWNGESQDYGKGASAGDVVGCAVDTVRGEFRFTLNGDDMGVAFSGVSLASAATGGLYPAVSLEAGEVVQINLGATPFKFAPPTGARAVVSGRATLAPAPAASAGQGAGAGAGSGAGAGAAAVVTAGSPPAAKLASPASAPAPAAAAPSPAPAPAAAASEAAAPLPVATVSLSKVNSVAELEKLGMDKLKAELQARGLKCGGNAKQRAQRLFSVKGLTPAEYPRKIIAKKK